MTDDQTSVLPKRRARDLVRDGIVMISMTFVALAVGFGLHLQIGFAFWPAAAAAAAVYLAMLFLHLMLAQKRETSMLHRELMRLNIELAQLQRTPAEGGILREAPGSSGSNMGGGASQSYGYGRGYQPEVTVPLASVAGPDLSERSRTASRNTGPSTSPAASQVASQDSSGHSQRSDEMRARGSEPREDARKSPKPRSRVDDAADLLSDLGSVSDVKPTPVPTRLRQPLTVPTPTPTPASMVPPMSVEVQLRSPQPPALPNVVLTAAVPAPQPQPVSVKRPVTTEGDRDVEAIHDLIKKLAAEIVGGQAAVPAASMPTRASAVLPDRMPPTSAVPPATAKPVSVAPPTPVASVVPKFVSSGRVPPAAARSVPKSDTPNLAQALADQLDAMPTVQSDDRATISATVAETSPVAAAAVAAARTAVEARMASKGAPMLAAATTVLQSPIDPDAEGATTRIDGSDNLDAIGAQLAAGLSSEQIGEPAPEHDLNVQALKAAGEAMRKQPTVAALAAALGDPVVDDAQTVVGTAATSDPALRAELALLADAIDEGRFDVCLEAIVGLGERRAQHYEVTVRLKDFEGDVRQMAHGSGLLPLLDAAVVDQSARIAWKLEDRGKPGSLFSQITGESLESDRFLNRFADTYRHSETVASRLVLAFTQNDLRSFSASHWATLRDMADLGFRFSLEDLTDLDLDFEALKDAGFGFVKLDASVFLDGLPVATGKIPAAHICRHFEDSGLAVIVGRIGDEGQYEQVLQSGVGLGQGDLFGTARPVKADVLKPQHRAVA